VPRTDSSAQQQVSFRVSGVCKRAAQVQHRALPAHHVAAEVIVEMTGVMTAVMEMGILISSTAVMELFLPMKNVMMGMKKEETDVPHSAELRYHLISVQEENAAKEEMMCVDHLD